MDEGREKSILRARYLPSGGRGEKESVKEGCTETERGRDRDRERQRQTERERQRERQSERQTCEKEKRVTPGGNEENTTPGNQRLTCVEDRGRFLLQLLDVRVHQGDPGVIVANHLPSGSKSTGHL